MVVNGVTFPVSALAEICRRFGVHRISLFGSILRDDFRPTSDVDMLVEFHPQTRIGLVGLANLEAELSQAIGRQVDLRTAAELSPYFREQVVAHARIVHAA